MMKKKWMSKITLDCMSLSINRNFWGRKRRVEEKKGMKKRGKESREKLNRGKIRIPIYKYKDL